MNEYRTLSHKTPYETKSLDINNFQIKWNLKKVKTVTDRLRSSLKNSAALFLNSMLFGSY